MTVLARAVDVALEATVVGSFSRIGALTRRHLEDWSPVADLPGDGRTVLVTGANSGLGFAASLGFARAGAAVRLLVRSDAKGDDTRARIHRAVPGADVGWYVADLTDLDSVRAVAAAIVVREPRLDALVHNAGAMFPERSETATGIERTVALHVVGPHLLTALLLEPLAATGGRVVWVSSGGMYTVPLSVDRLESPDDYRPATAYARAKRAQVVLAAVWQARLGDRRGVSFHAMHPGWARTPGVEASLPVFRRVMGPVLRSPEQGADTIVWLGLADEPTHHGGRFWHDRRPRSTTYRPGTGLRPGEDERLWERVSRLAGVDV